MSLLLENLKHLENTEFCLRLHGSREISPRATGPLPPTGNAEKRRVLLREQGKPCRAEWLPLMVALNPELLCPATPAASQLCLPNSGRLRAPSGFPPALQPRDHPGRELR